MHYGLAGKQSGDHHGKPQESPDVPALRSLLGHLLMEVQEKNGWKYAFLGATSAWLGLMPSSLDTQNLPY